MPYCYVEHACRDTPQDLAVSLISILHLAYPVCAFFEDRCQVSGTGYLAPETWYPAPEPV